MPKRIFIAYDLTIAAGLKRDLHAAKKLHARQSAEHAVDFAASNDNATQGEIWRDALLPRLREADAFLAFIDKPNANVCFEAGFALGHAAGKRAALACITDQPPAWLKRTPLSSYLCPKVKTATALAAQLASDESKDWFVVPDRPQAGERVLVLCPKEAGDAWRITLAEHHPDWDVLDFGDWTMKDIGEKLHGVGTLLWLIVAHREGENQRDGAENSACALVAGFGLASGAKMHYLFEEGAREVCDVTPVMRRFADEAELLALLADIAATFEPPARSPADSAAPAVPRPNVGLAPRLEDVNLERRFIGRERQLSDVTDAAIGLEQRFAQRTVIGGAARVQAFWYVGFGGMGKSWLLRRAIQRIGEQLRGAARVALVDWDVAALRYPLLQPPETARELLRPIAWRLAQLYGAPMLDEYWLAEARADAAAAQALEHRQRFHQELQELQKGKTEGSVLEGVLQRESALADPAQRLAAVQAIRRDRQLHERVFAQWFDAGGGSAVDRDAVLTPDALRVGALQQSMRAAAAVAPLVLVLDTCELMGVDVERWLRRLAAPLCDGATAFVLLIGSRHSPDMAEPAGSRDVWRSAVGGERWRLVRFDEGVRFTVDEIAHALERSERPVPQSDALAENLHRVTQGLPLALRTLIDMHEKDESVLEDLAAIDPGDLTALKATDAEARVVAAVVDRFLLHLRGSAERRADLMDIITLSLLRRRDEATLARLWPQERPAERLRALSRRYSLMSDGDLHATVRSFMRRRWRSADRPPEVDEAIAALGQAVDAAPIQHEDIEAGIAAALQRINASSWRHPKAAVEELAAGLAFALGSERAELAADLASIAVELGEAQIRAADRAALETLLEGLQSATVTVPAWGSDEVIAWLLACERTQGWDGVHRALLALIDGLRLTQQAQLPAAFDRLQAALQGLSDAGEPVPRRAQVGSALFDIGYAWIEAADLRPRSIRAFERCIELGYSEGGAHNNIGVLRQRAGDLQVARRHFEAARGVDPQRPLYAHNLGDVQLRLGEHEAAIALYREASALEPESTSHLRALASAYEAQGRIDEAREVLEQAAAHEPPLGLDSRTLGDFERRVGRLDAARAAYSRALQLAPGDPDAINGIANVLSDEDRIDDAAEAYRRAFDLAPKTPLYARNLGDLYRKHKRYMQAEQWYAEALAVDPEHPGSHNGLGLIALAHGRLAEARARFRRAWLREPLEPVFLRNLADVERADRQDDEALAWLRRALEVAPRDSAIHRAIAGIHEDRRQIDDARACLLRAIAAEPRRSLNQRALGDFERRQREPALARQAYEEALRIDPKDADAVNGLALLADDAGDNVTAERGFLQACELAPKTALFRTNLASLMVRQRRLAEARAWNDKALLIAPEDANVQASLGWVAIAEGDLRRARHHYERACELEPHEIAYLRSLADAEWIAGDLQAAEQVYRKALNLKPADPDARIGLAYVLRFRGQAALAVSMLAELADELPALRALKMQMESARSDFDPDRAAIEARMRAVLAEAGDDAECLNTFAWFLFKHGAVTVEALEMAERAVALDPSGGNLHTLACLQYGQHREAEAEVTLRAWIRDCGHASLTVGHDDSLTLLRLAAAAAGLPALREWLAAEARLPGWQAWREALQGLPAEAGIDDALASAVHQRVLALGARSTVETARA